MKNVQKKQDKRHELGRLGEDIATKYLKSKGFDVVGRNYRKKYGEIDLIAQKGGITHFIEVKSVSRENFDKNVSRVMDNHRPEDNIHPQKLKRLARTIQAYLLEKFPESEPEWQFHAITVQISLTTRRARVKFIENLIL